MKISIAPHAAAKFLGEIANQLPKGEVVEIEFKPYDDDTRAWILVNGREIGPSVTLRG